MKYGTTMRKSLASVCLMMLFSGGLNASERGVLVVSDDVKITGLTKDQLAGIFLGQTTMWNSGRRINIGYSTKDGERVEAFFQEYIGKSQRRFKKYWVKKVFAGYGIAPKLFSSNEKALEYVKRLEGVIVFVTPDASESLKGFRIVSIEDDKKL